MWDNFVQLCFSPILNYFCTLTFLKHSKEILHFRLYKFMINLIFLLLTFVHVIINSLHKLYVYNSFNFPLALSELF